MERLLATRPRRGVPPISGRRVVRRAKRFWSPYRRALNGLVAVPASAKRDVGRQPKPFSGRRHGDQNTANKGPSRRVYRFTTHCSGEADDPGDGVDLLPRAPPYVGPVVRRLPRTARLQLCPAGPLPVRVGKARMRQLHDPLLQAGDAVEGSDGNALRRSAYDLAASDPGTAAPARRSATRRS